jgi:hypothetical protein
MLALAEPLTEKELEEKDDLIFKGFPEWSRRDFQQFVEAWKHMDGRCLFLLSKQSELRSL